jgi:hypothetical protein
MLADDPRGNLRWDVEVLEKNSPPGIGLRPNVVRRRNAPPPPPNYAEVFERTVVKNIAGAASGPPRMIESPTVLKDMERLALLTATIGEIRVSVNGDTVAINETTLKNVRELTAKKYEGVGSVLGRLEAISVHGTNEIRVWDENSGRPVVCVYPESLEEDLKKNLRKRVIAFGLVSFNATGQPIAVALEGVDPYPEVDTLPTIEQVSGLIKNLRGGLTLKEYMEKLRDE